MKRSVLVLFITALTLSCSQKAVENEEMPFDKTKWNTKDEHDYLYRDRMVDKVVYNDTIRTLNKVQLLELLGKPDYTRDEHLYYRISETKIGFWTLKTKTMVIKLEEDKSIVWIKIHD